MIAKPVQSPVRFSVLQYVVAADADGAATKTPPPISKATASSRATIALIRIFPAPNFSMAPHDYAATFGAFTSTKQVT